MSKAFFDVFPYVKLESRLKALMEQVAVQKIVNVSSAGYLRVHIESSYLIPKEDINKYKNGERNHAVKWFTNYYRMS